VLGDRITDKEVIKKILHSMPEHLEQVAISIETLLDLNSMSIEEATSHLRAVEQRKKKLSGGAKDGQLLLTEEEWLAHLKAWEGKSSGGSGRGCGRGRGNRGGRCGGSNNGGGRGSQTDSCEEGARRPKPTDVCRACGKLGHWAKECRSKWKIKTGQAHMAEEEEGGLMLMEAVACPVGFEKVPNPAAAASPLAMVAAPRDFVHLVEGKVFAHVDEEEEIKDTARWVVDTGATSHMIDAHSAFAELDVNIRGTVRFGGAD
jgi:hypothetical protein